jgi:hypothetical protein
MDAGRHLRRIDRGAVSSSESWIAQKATDLQQIFSSICQLVNIA